MIIDCSFVGFFSYFFSVGWYMRKVCQANAMLNHNVRTVHILCGIRTILSPDISQSVKFAGSDNSQFVDFQARTFLSYLFCRVGQFSVNIFQSIAVLLYSKWIYTLKYINWEMSGLRIVRPCKTSNWEMSGPANQQTENCPTLQISLTEKCPFSFYA